MWMVRMGSMSGTTVSEEKRKSNLFGDANFMEHQFFLQHSFFFWENKTVELLSPHWGGFCLSDSLHGPVWNQPLMGWHPLYACLCPHWGNEAESVCCSGRPCVPFITVTSQKHTKRKRQEGGFGELCCSICPVLGFTTTSPTWRGPRSSPIHLHICLSGVDGLCMGSLGLPKTWVCTANRVWVELLTRQWWELQH